MSRLRVPHGATSELRAIIRVVNFLLERPNGGDNIHEEGFSCYRTRTGIITVRYRGADDQVMAELARSIKRAGTRSLVSSPRAWCRSRSRRRLRGDRDWAG